MTDARNNGAEERDYRNPEEIALSFGHVEARIDDLESTLVVALEGIATGNTPEERMAALDALCEALPTMRVHRAVA